MRLRRLFIFSFCQQRQHWITRLRHNYSCHEDNFIGEFIRNVRNAHTHGDRDIAKCYWVIDNSFLSDDRKRFKDGSQLRFSFSLKKLEQWNPSNVLLKHWCLHIQLTFVPWFGHYPGSSCNSWISSLLWEDWWQFDRKVDRVEVHLYFLL